MHVGDIHEVTLWMEGREGGRRRGRREEREEGGGRRKMEGEGKKERKMRRRGKEVVGGRTWLYTVHLSAVANSTSTPPLYPYSWVVD